ncbi:peptide/nickel transport system substrate-binding protein [Pseudosulfitobacter pseudonitzschiae]|uniref:ABC transporter substrate-binding protein n=1 Tax=Pseudosulfitobacter pseudonitzschiae TaxID=1402135 RepID=A0A073IVD5_9RHOB|nr:ABC transporter substrate-binding protein [Pseudosulfitobacter pseudonitzschiae]KEJ94313.1 ABC transporter substrate-binding protein [Pseudosulfitobacter pseudonitzschiae]QKS11674.1 ABC transporter substrate-binding protein [Pseudosulfitobacter pseudonitzschiae]SHG21303.1 peptide/nickel transport system substrate-binding protein [Pseudosulfitobacter pseudonitzschiae]
MKHTLAFLAAALIATALPAQADDTLDVVAQFEIQSPEPSTTGYIFTRMGITETLTHADPQGVLTPGLATDWTADGDGLSWTFTLRDGVRFHDGTAMTAEAVAAALDIARTKPGPLAKTPITAIKAMDGAVVITLSDPFAALPAYLAHFSAQILAPAAYGAEDAGVTVIGTGPYKITDLAPPLSLKAEAFDGYWGPAPHVPNVRYSAVSRVETRALMAESGDADFVFGLDPASVARLGLSDAVTVHSVAIPRVLLIKVNADHPALSEPEARRALSLAIDREGIARAVLRYPEGATQLFPPSVGAWHNDSLVPLAHDPGKAKELLQGLGWTMGGDGILTRNGERFALTLTTYPDRPELPLVAAVLEQQFRAIGAELTINTTNSSEISAGHADGSLDLGLIARNFGLIPNPVGTILSDYAPTGDWGAMGWQNDEITDLARSVGRGDGGAPARARITEILQTELPIIPIAWYRQTLAVAKGVEGAVIDPWERTFGLPELRLSQ